MAIATVNVEFACHSSAAGNASLLDELRRIVGPRHALTRQTSTRRYRTGFRFGERPVLAVIRPGTLVEQWRVLERCAAANKIIIVQAANTGLTGGSTPEGGDYDREIVIVSTLRISRIRLIDEGRQVVCHPGATLSPAREGAEAIGAGTAFRHRIVLYPCLRSWRDLQ